MEIIDFILIFSMGRRPVFIVTVVTMTITRIVMLFTTYSYVVFMIVSMLSSATLNSGFQSPLTISMETISVKMRATLISIQYLGWTIGICILPLIMWAVRRWDYFFLITTLPGLLIFIFYKYVSLSLFIFKLAQFLYTINNNYTIVIYI